MRTLSRRTFLVETLQAAGLVFVSALGSRTVAAGEAPSGTALPAGAITLDRLDAYPVGKVTIVTTGKTADGTSIKLQLGVLRQADQVYVISTRCTHAGCTVKPRSDGTFRCPCHWSKYNASGVVVWGLAKESLKWFDARVLENGVVQVDLARTVAAPSRG